MGALGVGFRRVTGWSERQERKMPLCSHHLSTPANCRVMHYEEGTTVMKKEDSVGGDG